LLARGSTVDIYCSELAIGYEQYLHDKHKAEADGRAPTPAKYTTEQLQAMVDSVKKGTKVDG